jgi:hypothetical protein
MSTEAVPTAPAAAPATPAPSAPAPTAPTAEERRELAHRAGHGDSDAFAKWMGMSADAPPATSATAPPTGQAEPETGRVRGDGGKFVKADGTADPAATAAAATTTAPADTGAPAEKPAAERAAGIALLDAEGKALDVDTAAVKVRARIGGEDVELPLGDVLRRASGQAGAQRHAARLEQELGTMQTTHEQLQDQFEDLRVLGIRLALGEVPEQELAELRETLQAQLSPGAIAEQRREEQRTARERQRTEQEQEARASTATEMVPVLAALLRDNPDVTEEEINGRLLADTSRWCAPGSAAIKPEHLPDVRAYLATELPRFVRQRQAERTRAPRTEPNAPRATTPADPATTDVRRAQEAAQRAKNALAEAVRPSGALPVEGGPAKKPEFRNINDRAAYAVSAFSNVGR